MKYTGAGRVLTEWKINQLHTKKKIHVMIRLRNPITNCQNLEPGSIIEMVRKGIPNVGYGITNE